MTHRPKCRSQRSREERAQFVFTALTTWVPKEGTTPDNITGFLQLALHRPRRNTQPHSVSPPAAGQGSAGKVCTAQNPARAGSKVLLKSTVPCQQSRAAFGEELAATQPAGWHRPAKRRSPRHQERRWGGKQGKPRPGTTGERSKHGSAGLAAASTDVLLSKNPLRSRSPARAGSRTAEQPGHSGTGLGDLRLGCAGGESQGQPQPRAPRSSPTLPDGGFLWPVRRLFVQANPLGVY